MDWEDFYTFGLPCLLGTVIGRVIVGILEILLKGLVRIP